MKRALWALCTLSACSSTSGEVDTDGTADDEGTTSEIQPTSGSVPPPDSADSSSDGGPGTSGGTTTEEPYRVGSRLRPIFVRSEEGLERISRWFDPQLGDDCVFAESTEGFGCLPTAWWPSAFADDKCAVRATRWNSCDPAPMYGRTADTTCGVPTVMRRGAPLTTVYRLDSDGHCTEDTNAEGYRLEPADPSAFVHASRTLHAVDDALGRWEYEAEDGSAQWVGPVLLEDERVCEPVRTLQACLLSQPYGARNNGSLHSEKSCNSNDVAFASIDAGCPSPRFVVDASMGRGTVTHELDHADVWFGHADNCSPLTEQLASYRTFAYRAFEPGDAPGMLLEAVGDGRLQLQETRSVDGVRISGPHGTWFDTLLGIECGPYHGRCVPFAFGSFTFYADPSCEGGLLFDANAPQGAWRTFVDFRDPCEASLVGVAQVDSTHEGSVFRRSADGTCVPEDSPPSGLRTLNFHPANTLAPLEEI